MKTSLVYAYRAQCVEAGAYELQAHADRLIEGYLLGTFRAIWGTVLAKAFFACGYRAFISEGLSVGIERCYLRQHLGDMLVRSPDRWERQSIAAHLVVLGT